MDAMARRKNSDTLARRASEGVPRKMPFLASASGYCVEVGLCQIFCDEPYLLQAHRLGDGGACHLDFLIEMKNRKPADFFERF
jgi:hypothetical protein